MLLVIDNYDSFVHNLARYLRRLGQETVTVRNDVVTANLVRELSPAAIILSPGPGTPAEAGRSLEIVRCFADQWPMLGVCLGHQTLAAAFGGQIVRAAEPVHGRSSLVLHEQRSIFAGLPSPFRVGRYHSLVVEARTLPACLRALAHTAEGTLMALEHVDLPLVGVQFHPESVLTEHGFALLAAFLRRAGIAAPDQLPLDEAPPAAPLSIGDWPTAPITF